MLLALLKFQTFTSEGFILSKVPGFLALVKLLSPKEFRFSKITGLQIYKKNEQLHTSFSIIIQRVPGPVPFVTPFSCCFYVYCTSVLKLQTNSKDMANIKYFHKLHAHLMLEICQCKNLMR